MLNPVSITAITLSDAWFQSLYTCVKYGRKFRIDQGSFEGQTRCELDFVTIHITVPGKGDLLPRLAEGSPFPNPVEDDYLDDYLPYLMTAEEKEGESYTYGCRINKVPVTDTVNNYSDLIKSEVAQGDGKTFPSNVFWSEKKDASLQYEYFLNQMELLIWTYKNKGYRNNQMIMQIAQPSDILLRDPACLRQIDSRIQDGKLHFFPYFRSWDLYGGMPANLAAIELMKQYCAAEIGVENGEIIATSKGLHLYDYVFEIAEAISGKTIGEFENSLR